VEARYQQKICKPLKLNKTASEKSGAVVDICDFENIKKIGGK
jgi:hypothetical protein